MGKNQKRNKVFLIPEGINTAIIANNYQSLTVSGKL